MLEVIALWIGFGFLAVLVAGICILFRQMNRPRYGPPSVLAASLRGIDDDKMAKILGPPSDS